MRYSPRYPPRSRARRPSSAARPTRSDEISAEISAEISCETPLFRCEAHQAAVKALAWCPWQRNLLASGGGTADRMIRFWSTSNGACLNSVDTHSQVINRRD